MKKLLSLLALMGFMQINAQSIESETTRSGVYYALKLNAKTVFHDIDIALRNYGTQGVYTESSSTSSIGLNLGMGYHINKKLDVAINLAYDEYLGDVSYTLDLYDQYFPYILELRSMPLTAQFKYNFSERISSWYVSGDIGTQLNWSGKWASGAITAASFGKSIPISSKANLDAALTFDYRTVTNIPYVVDKIYSLGVSFGVSF
ncbi:hypothetical protein [Saccharicrinis aurantiacus]|uniref:hypothetical protein n=1 Tax=Saccharicrinis aurantiacus TaxID=1849719 RepID=UPI001115287F|nr:hypothetical protein [Saccharicrinis aurantiacus]